MNDTDLVVLGLLAEQPRHGYDLEELIEARGVRNWTDIAFSSIYYVLKRLAGRGWVESSLEEASRGPARKVYRLTAGGREALKEAVLVALGSPDPHRYPILLGLANLPLLEAGEALAALERYQHALDTRLEELQRARDAQQPLPFFADAMFAHGAALIAAERQWLADLMETVAERGRNG